MFVNIRRITRTQNFFSITDQKGTREVGILAEMHPFMTTLQTYFV